MSKGVNLFLLYKKLIIYKYISRYINYNHIKT